MVPPGSFNSWPLKTNYPKRKGSSSNQHFSGASCWTLGCILRRGRRFFWQFIAPNLLPYRSTIPCQVPVLAVFGSQWMLELRVIETQHLEDGNGFFFSRFWKETVDSFEFLRGMICNKMDLCVRINLLWVWLVLVKISSSWMETPYICSFENRGAGWRETSLAMRRFGGLQLSGSPFSYSYGIQGSWISELYMDVVWPPVSTMQMSVGSRHTRHKSVLKALLFKLISDLKCGCGAFRTSALTSKVTTTSVWQTTVDLFSQREPYQLIVNCWLAGWCFSLFVIGEFLQAAHKQKVPNTANHWPESLQSKNPDLDVQHLCVLRESVYFCWGECEKQSGRHPNAGLICAIAWRWYVVGLQNAIF